MTLHGFDAVQLLSLVVGVILPILTDLISKASWHGALKEIIHGLLAAATGFGTSALAALQSGAPFDWHQALILAAGTWLISTAVYFKVWRRTRTRPTVLNTLIKDGDLAA